MRLLMKTISDGFLSTAADSLTASEACAEGIGSHSKIDLPALAFRDTAEALVIQLLTTQLVVISLSSLNR